MDVLSGPQLDVHRSITQKIVKSIEDCAGEYRMPWHRSDASITRPLNAYTGQPYRGVNVLALWVETLRSSFGCGQWATYRQWLKLGAQVRKGERGSLIVFYKELDPEQQEGDQENTRPRLMARASWVFNAGQVDGWEPIQPARRNEVEVLDDVEAFVSATKADIRHGRSQACYNWAGDFIEIPDKQWFVGSETSSATESYYSVLLHEMTHWTADPDRLNRDIRNRYGTESYAMEELIAELGAAFLCADLGISNEPRPDHAAYVADWLTVLDRDQRAIFTAASKASAAVDYLAQLASRAKQPAGEV